MLQRSYDWVMEKSTHPHAVGWMAFISFVESSVFPIPPDIIMIPLILAQPERWFRIALVCTLSSVAGGYLGYAIGYYLMDSVGLWILDLFHLAQKFEDFKPLVDEYGAWVIIVKGATPIPYKLITIAAGAFKFDLTTFTFASIIARGMRFFLIGALLWKFGTPMREFIEKRLKLVMTATALGIIALVVIVKLL